MDDLRLEVELKVVVKPVNPKLGATQRGPYERNMFVVLQKASSLYVGDKTDIATMAADALKPLTRQWALSSSEPPQIIVEAPDTITTTAANINAKVHDHGVSTAVTCEYGTTKDLGSSQTATESPLSGDAWTDTNMPLTGLSAGTTYYYRIKAVSGGVTVYSELKSFTTASS